MAKIVILSGAGISAESGISTFRDSDGLWEKYHVEEVCNFDSLEKNEQLTLDFYDKRRFELQDKTPNHAHEVITKLKEKYKDDLVIITQNVDNLFEKAGLTAKDVIHLHGFLTEVRCRECGTIYEIGYKKINSFNNGMCKECNGKLRPNIVFFGEVAPKYEMLNYHLHDCEVFVVIGTSGNVITVNEMAQSAQLSILNNLEKNFMINDENFTKVFYDKATNAIDSIVKEIDKYFAMQSKVSCQWKTISKIDTPYHRIETAKSLIQEADAILITAGAGMGVDSGLPDFRGNEGLWNAYPPLKKAGYEFTQVESGYLFNREPHLAWGFYGHRIDLYRNTAPHQGFKFLLDLAQAKQNNYFIFTSNVDRHFQKAGFDRDKIYEVHGSIEYLQCINNCNTKIVENNLKLDVDMDTLMAKDVPYCKDCEEVMVPNILFFGGTDFNESKVQEQNKLFLSWLDSMKELKIVILEIGAGTTVPTIRNFNDSYSKRHENVRLIRINPVENEVYNDGDIGIKGKGLDIIEKII